MCSTSIGRLGLIVPSANTVFESEAADMLPTSVTIHSSRIRQRSLSKEACEKMADDALEAAMLLADARVDRLLYGVTAPSFLLGQGHDEELTSRIKDATGIPALTVAQGIIEGLEQLRCKTVALATPYPDQVTRQEITFLENHGYDVVGYSALGYTDVHEIGSLPSKTVEKGTEIALTGAQADVLLISCTNWASGKLLKTIESKYGIPVISSNSAGIRATMSVTP